MDDTLDTAR
jgi:hypothetical protein